MMRFAGQALKFLKDMAMPANALEGALEYGPNALGAVMMGALAPNGERLPVGAEDLAIGLVGSIGGRALGGGIGKALKLQAGSQAAGAARLAGSMGLEMPLAFLSPRPLFEAAAERAALKAQGEAQGEPQQQQQPIGVPTSMPGMSALPAASTRASAVRSGIEPGAPLLAALAQLSPESRRAYEQALGLG